MYAPMWRCKRLAIKGLRRGRGRPKKYWNKVIRHTMTQLQLTKDIHDEGVGRVVDSRILI